MPSQFSPRLQALSSPAPTNDQAKTLFEQGLSSMAYNVLLSKLPNVAPDVVTFKILDSDPDTGDGVGAFVVARQGTTFYIPVVMAENQIKPLDLLYHKEMNVFLPLSKEWLEQLEKKSVGTLGQGVTPPNTLSTDVDIRNTVVPPTTGRYSYAAEQDAGAPFLALEHTSESQKLAFLEFLNGAPNRVKTAVATMFETHPKLLKLSASFYGVSALRAALAPTAEKVADYGHRLSRTGALYVADKSTEAGTFKDIFGSDAGIAYQGMLRRGYATKDTRKDLKRVLKTEAFARYQEPKDAGAYTIWTAEGKAVTALIIGNPTDLTNPGANRVHARNIRFRNQAEAPAIPSQGNGVNYRMPGSDGTEGKTFVNRYVGVTEDGKLLDVTKLIGTPVAFGELEGSKAFAKTVDEASAAGPRAGQTGFFVMRKGNSFVGTRPVRVESVTNDSNGMRLVKVYGGGGLRTLAIHADHANGMLLVPPEGLIHVPGNYAWIPTTGELLERDLMTNPRDVLRFAQQSQVKVASETFIVKKGSHGFTFGAAPREGFEFVPALRKLATEAYISVEDAEAALKAAEETGRFEFSVEKDAGLFGPSRKQKQFWDSDEYKHGNKKYYDALNTEWAKNLKKHGRSPKDAVAGMTEQDQKALNAAYEHPTVRKWSKYAAEDPLAKKPKGDAPPEQDPAQMAMDQVQAAQMQQPQGPSPVDMAVAEQMQSLQMQMQALTQMQQLMQTVQQRANMIASGGAAANPAAAAAAMGGPMDPSMMGAGAPVPGVGGPPPDPMGAGAPQGMPPGQPGMPPGQPGMPPGQPGMPPGQPGMPPGQPGMPPGQPGTDPQQQPEQPPQAMMAADDGDVNSLAQQVNPQFMEQAGALGDAGMFDAAALSSMATTPALRDLVQAYLPNLEKALDNVGRVLLTLWMDETHVKEDIGAETFVGLEDNLRSVFKGLGELVLKVNQNALVMRDRNTSVFNA